MNRPKNTAELGREQLDSDPNLAALRSRPLHAVCRRLIRALQTKRRETPALLKLVLGTVLVVIFSPWWAYMRLRTLLRGPVRTLAETTSGHQLECHLPDMIQTYLYLFGAWEPDVAAFLRRRLQPGDVFIDVGANVGYFSFMASEQVGENGHVISIEASPRIFAQLQRNAALNETPGNMRLINKAASDRVATIDLYRGPSHNLGLTSTCQHRGMKSDGTIEAAPLHELVGDECLSRARLIKIDVEGGEDAVLSGLAKSLDRLRQDVEILVELSPAWWSDREKTPRDVLAPLVESGFNIYEVCNNYWPWRYMWPRSTEPPKRFHGNLNQRVNRLDFVLSRVDADAL